jgi:hypothetical protein
LPPSHVSLGFEYTLGRLGEGVAQEQVEAEAGALLHDVRWLLRWWSIALGSDISVSF